LEGRFPFLEFIFENPIAIIFIIGAIISFFKKMRENSNPNPNQEKKPELKKVLNIPQPQNGGGRVETRPPREQRQNSSQSAKEYYEVKSNIEINQPKENARKSSASQRKEINKEPVNDKFNKSYDPSPSKDTLIDGIVWAEILGPPRAYKSHSQGKAPYRR
jgi:hypothetical protein